MTNSNCVVLNIVEYFLISIRDSLKYRVQEITGIYALNINAMTKATSTALHQGK